MNTTNWKIYWESHDPYLETKTKKCSLCKKEKAGKGFYRSRTDCTGLQSQCIDCVSKRPTGPPRYRGKSSVQYMESWRNGNSDYWKTHDPHEEVLSKMCTHCKREKSSRSFYKSWTDKDGLQAWCIKCVSDRHRNNPKRQMIVNARARARKKGLEFSISEANIVIPNVCPVLGIALEVSAGARHRDQTGRTKSVSDNSPSLDRKNNHRGYTADNICVISYRANSIKRDANLEEMEKVLAYMRNNEASISK